MGVLVTFGSGARHAIRHLRMNRRTVGHFVGALPIQGGFKAGIIVTYRVLGAITAHIMMRIYKQAQLLAKQRLATATTPRPASAYAVDASNGDQ
ncbi:MAG: hypothetical protein Alpg2KO_12220 [Alphaproteobacteria bacterium]